MALKMSKKVIARQAKYFNSGRKTSKDNIPYPRNHRPPQIKICLQNSKTRAQNNDLSMTKLEKPHYRKLKAQRKENPGSWSLGCELNQHNWSESCGRQMQICG